MTKPYLISVAIHVLALGFFFIALTPDTADTNFSDIVRIHIRNQSMNSLFSGQVRAASPSESNRSIRKSAGIPDLRNTENTLVAEPSAASPKYNRMVLATSKSADAELIFPGVSDVVEMDSLEAVDPLAGFEDILPAIANRESGSTNPWSVTWAGGGDRGIVSAPQLNQDELPEETERLKNIVVNIKVSPRGDVISAEIEAPGSGDIRIDRSIHNAALLLVLEPWPDEKGDQEGRLRLVFQEGYR